MEFVEPKRGDRIEDNGRITTIDSFHDDHGTKLYSGRWVCISDYTKGKDNVWRKEPKPDEYAIGETYENYRSSRKGSSVIRSAVFLAGANGPDKVITSSPCCTLHARRLDFDDLNSTLAAKQGGWSEKCTGCNWHYSLTLVFTGSDPRLGLYGVRWESKGF